MAMADVRSVGMGAVGTMMRPSLSPSLSVGLEASGRARSVTGLDSGADGQTEVGTVAPAPVDRDANADEQRRLAQACSEFEAIFIEMVLKSARASIPKGGLFSSEEQELVREMLDAELAKEIASGGGIGVAKFMERNMACGDEVVKRGGSGEL